MGAVYQTNSKPRRVAPSDLLSGGSVQVRGESIYYEAAGMAEHGPTILFLHESGGSSATWHGQLTGLAQGARCLAPDLPGHGRSEGLGYGSVAGYRQAVLGFLDALAIRWPVIIVGVCLGAAIATDLAVHAPERVAALVLSAVVEGGRASEQVRQAVARGEATEAYVHDLFGEGISARMLLDRVQRWRTTSPVVRHGDLTAIAEYPMLSALSAVSHPVLLMAGEQDRIASPAVAQSVAQSMPMAKAITVPGAACLTMAEQPGAFNRHVLDFMGRLAPSSPIGPEVRRPGGYRRF